MNRILPCNDSFPKITKPYYNKIYRKCSMYLLAEKFTKRWWIVSKVYSHLTTEEQANLNDAEAFKILEKLALQSQPNPPIESQHH